MRGKGQRRIDDHLLSCSFTERLCPADLPGIPLHLEVLVALGSAESKFLRIVSDKHDTVTRIDRAGTEVASMDPHCKRL